MKSPSGTLVEPLTRRERAILQHLAEDKSNREIAALEVLSLNSVKWYIQQIYGKLGVNRRREAIERARSLGLLPPLEPTVPPETTAVETRPSPLPSGTVTFLFTDIEGSTPMWEQHPQEMAEALQIHNTALRRAIEANGGVVFKTVGDAFQAAFPTAPQALKAAIDGQHALQSAPWNKVGPLRVRMGLHTGEAQVDPGGDEYAVSQTKNRIGRIHSAACGGQIVLSQETADLVARQLPEGVTLKDLGDHHLKGLQWPERLYQVKAPGLVQEFPPLPTTITRPNNLPLQLTSFIGREKEIAEICRLLNDHRLVTLTGSGGTGKTRLALAVAVQVLDNFEHGAWLAELAPLADPEKVTRTVATALGLQEEGGLPILEVLCDYVKRRRLLLVLDNCEHLLEACCRLMEILLHASPGVTVLASSREGLGIGGEVSYRVPELSNPDLHQSLSLEEIARSEAVCLFADRAAMAQPGFQVTDQNAPAVVKICRRLDGIPLAIELAAARVSVLSVEQIAARLSDRFRLLTGGSRTALPRQQTMRASIDWSYHQLSDMERLLLGRLSVFVGGWTLEAAESICTQDGIGTGEVLDTLTSLVKKSLVTFISEAPGWPGQGSRYRMLETIRQYAREKLVDQGGGEDLRCRHLEYFLAMAEQAEAEFYGPFQRQWMERLDIDLDNLRAALEWGQEDNSLDDFQKGLRLITSLSMVEFHISAEEVYDWLEKYQARPEWSEAIPFDLQAKTWLATGWAQYYRGNFAAVRQIAAKCLALYSQLGDAQGQVNVLLVLTLAMWFTNEPLMALECVNKAITIAQQAGIYEENQSDLIGCKGFCNQQINPEIAKRCLVESLDAYEKKGDRLGSINALRILGLIASEAGNYELADYYLQKAVATSREMRSLRSLAWDLSVVGDHIHRTGRFEQMEACFQEVQSVAEKVGYRRHYVWSIHHRGVSARRLGQLERAIQLIGESLRLAQEYGFIELVVECLLSLVGIAADLGRGLQGARMMGAMEACWRNYSIGPIVLSEMPRDASQLRAMLGDEAYEAALLEGKALTLEQAVQLAKETTNA
jgi:predicted ATPase/class 3 adenylate cyclase